MKEMIMTLEDYGRKPTFSSFLPGIAGMKGIPIWCYYVNRGQAIVSFGVEDKDHSIMEFYPAHQAYQNVKRLGFRTFIRIGERCLEPFHEENKTQRMKITMNGLSLEEIDLDSGLKTEVDYYVLPKETVGALIRRVTVTNESDQMLSIEVLDGMPALIPYGVNQWTTKYMCQTGKAWMQVEDLDTKLPYFRVRASMEDTADVSQVEGGNFSLAVDEMGNRLYPIVDAECIFGYDTSMEQPIQFWQKGLDSLMEEQQNCQNVFPCSFYGKKSILNPKESLTIYQLIGQVESKAVLQEYAGNDFRPEYFEQKKQEAEELVSEMTKRVETHTGDPVFDAYCCYTYMDNALRGGYPTLLPGEKVFYTYSRKHGDLERDYNYFSIRPEYYSQGNGNFRDVNQNRRCDVSLSPFVGTENIDTFYSLIQLDGYNPLQIDPVAYRIEEKIKDEFSGCLKAGLDMEFTPGQLYHQMRNAGISKERQDELFADIMQTANKSVRAAFKEGYWCDHWTYNLDLIEDYCSIYPDHEESLLFDSSYPWYPMHARVLEREKRYVKTEKGIRQYRSVEVQRQPTEKVWEEGNRAVLKSTLMEKLLLLCGLKFATLDFYGMGIEMEGGKPGWYDALNGLPGLLGSSMAETIELERLLRYTTEKLNTYGRTVSILTEVYALLEQLAKIGEEEWNLLCAIEGAQMSFWNRINDVKETYRRKAYDGLSGEYRSIETALLSNWLEQYRKIVSLGVRKAQQSADIMPTYFYYEVVAYQEEENGIRIQDVIQKGTPPFLEGTVHLMKGEMSPAEKRTIHEKIKSGPLYDTKLHMYKVNASLNEATYELGRATAFTPGWLENESIWLHMEYKYFLELLRSGLYQEFMEAFQKAGIPFLDEKIYGRSVLENSSFIVSSSNPNPKLHGRGFVARLSGSTAEFLHMWKIMMFGQRPFYMEGENLVLTFTPLLPGYLTTGVDEISAVFLGKTKVVYRINQGRTYVPGEYSIRQLMVLYENGDSVIYQGDKLEGKSAEDVRDGKACEIRISII